MSGSPLAKLVRKIKSRRLRRGLALLKGFPGALDLHAVACEPEKATIVVLAPHMDDEVLGCGGTLARHAAAGADIEVVFLTDGRYGGSVARPGTTRPDPNELIAIRKREAHEAMQVLGVRALNFLDAEDTRLASDTTVAARLRAVLERVRPQIVYVPYFLDRHPDHRAANATLMNATRDSGLQFECRGYEVWTPLVANCLVRIDETIHLKEQAMRCYTSQLAVNDYLHSGIGLNAYRSMGSGMPARFVEAFFSQPLGEYLRLYAAVCA